MGYETDHDTGAADNLNYEPMHDYRSVDVEAWSKVWWASNAEMDNADSRYLETERYVSAQLGLHPGSREVDARDLGFMMDLLSLVGSQNPHQADSESTVERSQFEHWEKIKELGCVLGRQLVRNTLTDAEGYAAFRIEQERAGTDYLTGAPNRRGLVRRLRDGYGITSELERRSESGETLPPVDMTHLYFDANRFRWINKTLGHHIGDAAIVEAYWEVVDIFRESDILYRHGGDEFGALLEGLTQAAARTITDRIIEKQLERARSDEHLDAINAIEAKLSEITEAGGALRIEARQKHLSRLELSQGVRPHHILYINGSAVTELRNIVTLSVGSGSGMVSNLDDIERLRQEADAAMIEVKGRFEDLLGGMREVGEPEGTEAP